HGKGENTNGLIIAMSIFGEGNTHLYASHLWKLFKEDLPLCSIVMRASMGKIYFLVCL
nr:methionine--tRNA ligase [Tanacetum cinerariifolium]